MKKGRRGRGKAQSPSQWTPRIEAVEHEPYVYVVESRSHKVPRGCDWRECGHRVELIASPKAIAGRVIMRGTCTCEDMRFHHSSRFRCRHIMACIPVAYESLAVCWARHHRELLPLITPTTPSTDPHRTE